MNPLAPHRSVSSASAKQKNAEAVKSYLLENVVLTGLTLAWCATCYINNICFLNGTVTICCLICLPTTLPSGTLPVPSFSSSGINIHTNTQKNWTSSQTKMFLFLKLFPSLLSQVARCLCWITWYSDFSYSKRHRQPEAPVPSLIVWVLGTWKHEGIQGSGFSQKVLTGWIYLLSIHIAT